MGLSKDLAAYEALIAERDNFTRRIANDYTDLSQRIREGETTGDPIRDFVFVCAKDDEKAYDFLTDFQNRLRAHQGAPILIAEYRKKEIVKYVNSLDVLKSQNELTTVEMGTITDGLLRLDLNESLIDGIILPTEGYVRTQGEEWSLFDVDFTFSMRKIASWEEFTKIFSGLGSPIDIYFNVILGKKQVKAFLEENSFPSYNTALELLTKK